MSDPFPVSVIWSTTSWAPLWNAWHYVACPEHRTWYDTVSKVAMRLSYADWDWPAPASKENQLFAPPKVVAVSRTPIGGNNYAYSIFCYPDTLFDGSVIQWSVYTTVRPRAMFRYLYTSVRDRESPAQSRGFSWDWTNFNVPNRQIWYAAQSRWEIYPIYEPPGTGPAAFVPRAHPGSTTNVKALNVPLSPLFVKAAFPSAPPAPWPPDGSRPETDYFVNWRPPDNFQSDT